MKTITWTTILALLLSSSVLAVPIPSENEADQAFAVKEINNTSVCVISRKVYQDTELLPSENPCELCRCRPPGIACTQIQCGAKEAKPNCELVKVKGQCCPQYQCEQEPTEPAPSPDVTEQPEPSEVEARNDPTEASKDDESQESQTTLVPPSGEIEQRSADGAAGTSQEPQSADLVGSTSAPEQPREERLELAQTEEAKEDAPTEAQPAEEPTEAPERESKSEGATSEGPTAAPEKSERKDDAEQAASTEGPKEEEQEQGRSADEVPTSAPPQDEPESATKSVEDEPLPTEQDSGVTPRSDVSSGEGNSAENSAESTEPQPEQPDRKRRETHTSVAEEPAATEEKDEGQTEAPTAEPADPQATEPAITEEPEKRPTASE